MKSQILFILALDEYQKPVAGALYYVGKEKLFGRHWGCLADYKALHFELCYYQGIEFAIENGLKVFEAGAQGEHKFNRGFLPSLTFSAHTIRDPKMDSLIKDFVKREKLEIQKIFSHYAEHSPFENSERGLRNF